MGVREQGALANARLAADYEDSARADASVGEQPLDRCALELATEQHPSEYALPGPKGPGGGPDVKPSAAHVVSSLEPSSTRGDELMAVTEQAVEIDEQKLGAFMGQAVGELGATLSAALVVIGDRLGLYKAMAGAGALTPARARRSAPAPPSATCASG